MCLICLSVCPFIGLSVLLFMSGSICLPACLSVCMYVSVCIMYDHAAIIVLYISDLALSLSDNSTNLHNAFAGSHRRTLSESTGVFIWPPCRCRPWSVYIATSGDKRGMCMPFCGTCKGVSCMPHASGLHDHLLLCYICIAHLLRQYTKVAKCVNYITCISAFMVIAVSSHPLNMPCILCCQN